MATVMTHSGLVQLVNIFDCTHASHWLALVLSMRPCASMHPSSAIVVGDPSLPFISPPTLSHLGVEERGALQKIAGWGETPAAAMIHSGRMHHYPTKILSNIDCGPWAVDRRRWGRACRLIVVWWWWWWRRCDIHSSLFSIRRCCQCTLPKNKRKRKRKKG